MQVATLKKCACAVCLLSNILICSSCVSLVVPKGEGDTQYNKNLIDTWELMYQVDKNGDVSNPRKNIRVLMEFTDKGNFFLNWFDSDTSETLKSRSGRYTTEGNRVTIEDKDGNTDTWPYAFEDGKLVLALPAENKRFVWQRI